MKMRIQQSLLVMMAAATGLMVMSCSTYNEFRNPTTGYEGAITPKPDAEEKPEPKPQEIVKEEAPEPEPPKPEPKPEKKKEVAIEDLDLRGDFPTATPVEGSPGIVISPHSNKKVDVKDVPSGSLIADPRYPLEERKWFIVP